MILAVMVCISITAGQELYYPAAVWGILWIMGLKLVFLGDMLAVDAR